MVYEECVYLVMVIDLGKLSQHTTVKNALRRHKKA